MPFETVLIAPRRSPTREAYVPPTTTETERGRILDALHRAEAGVRLRAICEHMNLSANDIEESESSVTHDHNGDLVAYVWCATEADRLKLRAYLPSLHPNVAGLDQKLRETARGVRR